MKVRIKNKDQRYRKLIKVGEVVDLPNRVADRIITKGCGEIVEDKPVEAELDKENILEVKKPKRKRKKKVNEKDKYSDSSKKRFGVF